MMKNTLQGVSHFKVWYALGTVLAALLLFTCTSDDGIEPKPRSSSINKIMPLGASRVEGSRPEFESFRYELWKDLLEGGWTFDFIGTQSDNASYPGFNGNSFDVDHEGRGGWTSEQILGNIANWLNQTGPPDIVLFSLPGGNDILGGSSIDKVVANVNAVIDILQAANPDVIIIIEQLAPTRSDLIPPGGDIVFDLAHQSVLALATEQSTTTSRVIPVDMFTGFTDDLLADDVHYNEDGAAFIANRYYDVLVNVLEREVD